MLEDTKKYFEQDQKAVISEPAPSSTAVTSSAPGGEKPAGDEKPVSSVAPTLNNNKIDLSKHNKVILPNNPPKVDVGAKKFGDYKKGIQQQQQQQQQQLNNVVNGTNNNTAANTKPPPQHIQPPPPTKGGGSPVPPPPPPPV